MKTQAGAARPAVLLAAALLALAAAAGSGWAAWQWHRGEQALQNLQQRVAQRVAAGPATQQSCARWLNEAAAAGTRPLVLLVLGQSNAGNHGTLGGGGVVNVVTDAGTCHRTTDPLPGATGRGGSIWSHLPAALTAAGETRPVVLGVLAVDASSVREWNDERGPLPVLLQRLVRQMQAQGLAPDHVLWQQGEADALAGTSPAEYQQGLLALEARLQAAGVKAPLWLARSTVCRSEPATGMRRAMDELAARDARFALGPDTDLLTQPGQRSDGCHLGLASQEAAAALWAQALVAAPRR